MTPRRPRIQLDDVLLHIVQRGHNREACFIAEDGYQSYLHWLGEALAAHECKLHAYVLMTNHVHLLLTPKRAASVPRLIMSIGRRYVQYINRTHRRTGTLWDSRYKSSVIHADTYLLACQRYIELNPVRAAMAGRCMCARPLGPSHDSKNSTRCWAYRPTRAAPTACWSSATTAPAVATRPATQK